MHTYIHTYIYIYIYVCIYIHMYMHTYIQPKLADSVEYIDRISTDPDPQRASYMMVRLQT